MGDRVAKCENCGLTYGMGVFGYQPATVVPYTCDGCGGRVDEVKSDG